MVAANGLSISRVRQAATARGLRSAGGGGGGGPGGGGGRGGGGGDGSSGGGGGARDTKRPTDRWAEPTF